MEPSNFSSLHIKSEPIFLKENITLDFPKFLRPALETLLLLADNYLQFAEDKLFDTLDNSYGISDTADVLIHMKLPMTYLFVLFACTLMVLFALPFVCFVHKYGGAFDATRMQYCFCADTMGLMFCMVLMMIGISVYFPIGQEVSTAIRHYPTIVRNMIQNINCSVRDYEVQVQNMERQIMGARSSIARDVDSIPSVLRKSVEFQVGPDLLQAAVGESKKLLNSSAAVLCVGRNAMIKRKINAFMSNLRVGHNYCEDLETAFTQLAQKELSIAVDIVLSNNVELPFRTNISNAIKGIQTPLLRVNSCLRFFQNFVESQILLRLPLYEVNSLRIIILFPLVYTGLFIILIFVPLFHGLGELRMQLPISTYRGKLDITISILNFALQFSMGFLWIMFLLTGMIYVIFWPMAILCRSISDGTIYTKYFDKTNLWGNNTWIDYALKDSLRIENTTMESIVDACERNETLMTALKLNQSSLEKFYVMKVPVNSLALQAAFNLTIDSILIPQPDGFEGIIASIDDTTNQFTLNLPRNCNERQRIEVQEFLVILKKVKNIIAVAKIYNENLLEKLIDLKHGWNQSFFNNITASLTSSMESLKKYVQFMVTNNIGNCYVIPYTVKHVKSLMCDHILYIIMALLVSFSIISFSMLFCLTLTYRLTNYIRGLVQYYECKEFSERYSSETSRSIALSKLNKD